MRVKTIFENVKSAMQDAEEMGGVASSDEYVDLMAEIIQECSLRIRACIATNELRKERT